MSELNKNFDGGISSLNNTVATSGNTSIRIDPVLNVKQPNFQLELTYKGLIRRLDYEYVIESLAGNWPVAVVPSSGRFTAMSKSGYINANAIFCPNTGINNTQDPNVMPYSIVYKNDINNPELFSYLRAKIYEAGSQGSDAVYSDTVIAVCDDCVQKSKPVVSLPAKLVTTVTTPTPSGSGSMPSGTGLSPNLISSIVPGLSTHHTYTTESKYREFDISLSNLTVGQQYSYRINKEFYNWPIEVFPSQGSVVADSKTMKIPVSVKFCQDNASHYGISSSMDIDGGTSEMWSMTTSGTLDTDLFEYCDPVTDMLAVLKTELNTTNENDPSIASNAMLVRCDNCIAKPTFELTPTDGTVSRWSSKPLFVAGSKVETPVTLQVTAQNIKNDTYYYTLDVIKADWPFIIPDSSTNIYVTDRSGKLDFKGAFCYKPSLCPPSGLEGVLSYSLAPDYIKRYEWYQPSVEFKANILDQNHNIIGQTNVVKLYCTDCLDLTSPVLAQ